MKPLPVITKDEEIRALKAMNKKLAKLLTDALDEMVRMRIEEKSLRESPEPVS